MTVAVPPDPAFEGVDLAELGTTALLRLLFERRLAWLAANGKAPSLSELQRLVRVRRQLEAWEAMESARPVPKRK